MVVKAPPFREAPPTRKPSMLGCLPRAETLQLNIPDSNIINSSWKISFQNASNVFVFRKKMPNLWNLEATFYIYIYIYISISIYLSIYLFIYLSISIYIYITSKRQFPSRKWLEVAQLGGVLVVHGATILDSHRVTHLMAWNSSPDHLVNSLRIKKMVDTYMFVMHIYIYYYVYIYICVIRCGYYNIHIYI